MASLINRDNVFELCRTAVTHDCLLVVDRCLRFLETFHLEHKTVDDFVSELLSLHDLWTSFYMVPVLKDRLSYVIFCCLQEMGSGKVDLTSDSLWKLPKEFLVFLVRNAVATKSKTDVLVAESPAVHLAV